MNYFEFERAMYEREKVALDDSNATLNAEVARRNTPEAKAGTEKSAKPIAEFSKGMKILSSEELMEHRKHCRAKPGNCPFEKAVDEADDITPKDIKVTKQEVFDRLAAVMTQMFQMAKNLAKPAIADAEKVEENVSPTIDSDNSKATTGEKVTGDEAPDSNKDTNEDAKIVAEIIEGGIEKMVELAKNKGCSVKMDDNNTRYIVQGPAKQ